MKKKIKILSYRCEKCDKDVYFRSDEEYSTQCKTCKNEMKFQSENKYDPKVALSAIEGSNHVISKPMIECPYCHSTNTERIRGFNRSLWFADASAVGKQFQCNRCSAFF